MEGLRSLELGSAVRGNGEPANDTAIIFAGEINITFDGDGSPELAEAIVRAAHALPSACKALKAVRDACRDPDTDTAMPSAVGELVVAALAAMGERS
ncbi:hypothetical protein [Methylorubrum extorquens]|uniref:Uncharacterized protein n=1 Tax=Methylorubrum extorquens (strain CM4 / NCIMB 13688) TaxID=440085 RepID=B7KTG9_METC4|nr:hypothetical protein [Methylorubrum extorquens]ACK82496.1 hypothetical protein Mchl_1632 [Methylorubrum extorquens CM4]